MELFVVYRGKHIQERQLWETPLGHNTENLKQIFPEKELRGLSPSIHIHVSASDLYIPTIGLPILLQENMWTDPVGIYISLTDT